MREQIIKALQTIKFDFGENFLNNPKHFRNITLDVKIEGDGEIIRNILNIAVCEIKAYERLKIALNTNDKFIVNNLSTEMSKKFLMDKYATQIVIESIAEFVGYNVSPSMTTQHQSMSSSVTNPQVTPVTSRSINPSIEPLVKRGYLYLEDSDWIKADEYFNRVLDIEPEYAPAYIGKLCVEFNILDAISLTNIEIKDNGSISHHQDVIDIFRSGSKLDAIKLYRFKTGVGLREAVDFINSISHKNIYKISEHKHFQKALRFADPQYKVYLDKIVQENLKNINGS
jgi:tetratricopeptide (TPR) repeat protein